MTMKPVIATYITSLPRISDAEVEDMFNKTRDMMETTSDPKLLAMLEPLMTKIFDEIAKRGPDNFHSDLATGDS
jgi:hypothetical protein